MTRKSKIYRILSAITALFMLSLFSCEKGKASEEMTVGVLIKSDRDVFWRNYKKFIIEAAKETNVKLNIYAFDNDSPTQIDQIKTMLMNGISHFFIVPSNSDLSPQIAKIIDSKGGYAIFSNVVPTVEALKVSKSFYFTTSPETDAGAYQAEILDGYFKKNPSKLSGKTVNVLYFNGEFGHPAQIPRREGFVSAMEKKGYKVNFLSQIAANWNRNSARESMNIWIERNGLEGVNAVITQNDDMAIGAIEAFIEKGLCDNPANPSQDTDRDGISLPVPIIGVDGTAEGKKFIEQNQLYGSVFQDMKAQISTGFEILKECQQKGNAIGFVTSAGVKAATSTTTEPPLTDSSVLSQCFVVSYIPLQK